MIDNPTGEEYEPNSFILGTRLTGLSAKRIYVQEYRKKEAECSQISAWYD